MGLIMRSEIFWSKTKKCLCDTLCVTPVCFRQKNDTARDVIRARVAKKIHAPRGGAQNKKLRSTVPNN